jgi:polyphosphate glucokinase
MTPRTRNRKPSILAIDVGGTHVKFKLNGQAAHERFKSGPDLSARDMVAQIKRCTQGWRYDGVSIGYPGVVVRDRIVAEPHNLGTGWTRLDFKKAFGCPVKIVNDAVMQALGSYRGGRMLFLGLGTGLGSAMILDEVIAPMELGHLPYRKDGTFEEYVGAEGLRKRGRSKWRKSVLDVVARLMAALEPEYVVLGGGNAGKVGALPKGVALGKNDRAFEGAFRLWR